MAKYLNRTDLLLRGLIQQFKLYIVFIAMMTLFRIVFLFYFASPQYYDQHLSGILQAFFVGWKYDSIVASYFVVVFYLLILPVSLLKNVALFNFYQILIRFVFVLGLTSVALVLICDLGFYSFFQDHINILFFGLFEDDTSALMESIYKDYPLVYAISVFGIVFILLILWSKHLFKTIKSNQLPIIQSGFFKYIGMYLLVGVLLLGGLRGGYGELVLAPKYSDFSKNEFVNQMAYNGVIALEQSIKQRYYTNKRDYNMAKAMGYADNIYKAFSDYLGIDVGPTSEDQLFNLIKRRTFVNPELNEEKYHVIVLLMESFGNHWLNFHSEKFDILGDLAPYLNKGPYFNHIVSSDNGTIGSLMSVASNIPPRPGKRFLSESKFMRLKLDSAAHVPFHKNGYETTFIYGGKLAWRNIGSYFKVQGYRNLIGENIIRSDLNLPEKAGTEWGLYDEHFFEHIWKRLDSARHPQFILGLSTSNHPPFEVPSSYQPRTLNLPPGLEDKILREKDLFKQRFLAYQYANQKLAEFIQKIENSPLKDKVIVAVTGDHNFWGFVNYELSEAYSRYRVPLYLYLPEKLIPSEFNSQRIGSHEDIMITLYNLVLSDTEYFSFGEDLFSTADSFAFNTAVYASKEGVVYKGKNYEWNQIPDVKTDQIFKRFRELDTRYKSMMTISDYYLESMLKLNNQK